VRSCINKQTNCWSHSFLIIFHLNETAPEWPAFFFTNDDVIFSQPSPSLYFIDKYASTQTLHSDRDTAHSWNVNFEYAEKKAALNIPQVTVLSTGWWQTDKPLCVSITKYYKEPWTSPRLLDVRVLWKVGNFLNDWLLRERVSCEVGANNSAEFLEHIGVNPLKPELNAICYLLALLAHHFLHFSRIRVKLLTFRRLMSYVYIWSTHSWCF